jgi:hypothetical protein
VVEERRPGEGPLIDQAVGDGRRVGGGLELFLVDAGADPLRFTRQSLCLVVVAVDQRRQLGVLSRQREDPDRVEGGQQRSL